MPSRKSRCYKAIYQTLLESIQSELSYGSELFTIPIDFLELKESEQMKCMERLAEIIEGDNPSMIVQPEYPNLMVISVE